MTESPETQGVPVEAPAATEANLETPATDATYVPGPAAPLPPSNLAVGITAGVGLGLVAALVYAGVAIFAERELLVLGVLIGFAVAFGFHRFGHTRGIVPGIIAAVITLVLYFLAIYIEGGGAIAKEADVSFIDGLRFVMENNAEFLKYYFEDPLSYLFLAVSVGAAFIYAYDQKSLRFDRANKR